MRIEDIQEGKTYYMPYPNLKANKVTWYAVTPYFKNGKLMRLYDVISVKITHDISNTGSLNVGSIFNLNVMLLRKNLPKTHFKYLL